MISSPSSHRRRTSAGFTLLEVVLAVIILSLLTGSIYGLLRTAVVTAADLEKVEQQDRALDHFVELCRATIETLPPEATMTAVQVEGNATIQELTFEGVYDAFSFGEDPVSDSPLTIRLQPYELPSGETTEEPLYQVSITREDFSPEAEDGEMAFRVGLDDPFFQADEDGRYWLHLLPEITSLQWQFWNEGDEIWEDTWEDTTVRPPMMEMQIQPLSRNTPLRVVFDVPQIAASTTATAPATGGGGGGPGNVVGPGGGGNGGGNGGQQGGNNAGPGGDGRGPGFGPGGRGPGGRGPGFGPPGGGRGPGGPGGPGGRGPGGGPPGGGGGPGRPPQGAGGNNGGGGGGNSGGSGGGGTGGGGGN